MISHGLFGVTESAAVIRWSRAALRAPLSSLHSPCPLTRILLDLRFTISRWSTNGPTLTGSTGTSSKGTSNPQSKPRLPSSSYTQAASLRLQFSVADVLAEKKPRHAAPHAAPPAWLIRVRQSRRPRPLRTRKRRLTPHAFPVGDEKADVAYGMWAPLCLS